MITGKDVLEQMDIENKIPVEEQNKRLGIDEQSIHEALVSAGVDSTSRAWTIGGIVMGLEFAAKRKVYDQEDNSSRDEFLESIAPDGEDFAG